MLTVNKMKKEEKASVISKIAPKTFEELKNEELEMENEKQKLEEEIKKERDKVILKKTFNKSKILMIAAASKRRRSIQIVGLENLNSLEGYLSYRQEALSNKDKKNGKNAGNEKKNLSFSQHYFNCKKGAMYIFKTLKSKQALQHFSLRNGGRVVLEKNLEFSFVTRPDFQF